LFEKPHIGHIHVALISLGGAGEGTYDREGEPGDLIKASVGEAYLGTGLAIACDVRFEAFGKSVIFGLDLRKPAYDSVRSICLRSTATENFLGSSLST
jgi:hypothetical protein